MQATRDEVLTDVDYPAEIRKKLDEICQLRNNNKDNKKLYEILRNLDWGFSRANTYRLNDREQKILLGDMTAVLDALKLADAHVAIKDNEGADTSTTEQSLARSISVLLTRAQDGNRQWQDYLIYAGLALAGLLFTAAITTFLVGAAPLVFAGLLVAGIITAITTLAFVNRQSNHTFFGQNVKNHSYMADLIIHFAPLVEPEQKGVGCGCFG